MTLVLDSSLTIAWFVPDERSSPTQALLERVGEEGAIVPDFWRLEIGNGLLLATRRKRLTAVLRTEALKQLAALPIVVDSDTSIHAWDTTLQLADRFALTLYDACYLELARRRELSLATLDRQLHAAGHKLGLHLLGF
jgi:predicted nucleic acid-binding protein